MNCANWEERIALFAGGDLAYTQAAEVERHLTQCAACRDFAGGVKDSMALMRQTHYAELNASALAAVRARVIGELERGVRPARWIWIWGLSAVAAAALLIGAMLTPRSRKVAIEPPAQVRVAIADPAIPAAQSEPLPRRSVRHRRVIRLQAPRAPSPGPPLVVKLITDDPNVVIYWITDTRGE